MKKKILALVLFAVMMFALIIPVTADDMVVLTAPKFTPVLDGVKDDGYGPVYNVDQIVSLSGVDTGATGKLSLAWDDGHLYLYLEVTDTTPTPDHPNGWEQDNVDFYIDWNSGKEEEISEDSQNPYWTMSIHPQAPDGEPGPSFGGSINWTLDLESPSMVNYVVKPLVGSNFNGGYIIEVAFAVAAHDQPAKPLVEGGSLIMDLQISDNQGDQRDTMAYLTTDTDDVGNQWQWPKACRGLVMLAAGAPEPEPPPADDVPAPVDTPAASTPAANSPKTGDAGIIALMAIMTIAAAGIVVFKRKVVR